MRWMSLSAAAVLAGCATTAIVPTEGDWSYQALDYTEDTCGAAGLTATSIATLEALVISLNLTDEGFGLVLPGFDPVAVTQEGNDFSGVTGFAFFQSLGCPPVVSLRVASRTSSAILLGGPRYPPGCPSGVSSREARRPSSAILLGGPRYT